MWSIAAACVFYEIFSVENILTVVQRTSKEEDTAYMRSSEHLLMHIHTRYHTTHTHTHTQDATEAQ